jgi:outer membrane lipoprotein-sorting protein
MKSRSLILEWVLLLLVLAGLALAKEAMSDPYLILEKHFEAVGGLDRLKAQKTVYQEGTIVIEGAGLKGTFKQWSEQPLKLRQEIDLKVVKTSSGDNGEFSWEVDPNGKILTKRDDATIKERTVRKLMAEYEHLNRKSQYFTLTLEGSEKVEGKGCYVVKIVNNINDDIEVDYFDKSDFHLLKTVITRPDTEHHVYYSDFRGVDGMIMPFREVTITMPAKEKTIIEYENYVFNVAIDPILFEPPQQDVKDFEFVSGKSSETMPFEFIEDHIYLPVNLKGKERLWILDCGAGVNVIDSSFAAEIGLTFEGPLKGRGASGLVDCYYVTLPAYTIAGIKFEEQKVVAFSFRKMFHKALGLDVVGILGYDFLSRFVTRIDFANKKISFYDPEEYEYTGKGEIFDSPLQGNMLSLPVTVDGRYSGRMRLDIGAPDIDFHYPYANSHGLLERKGIDIMAGDAAGLTTSRISEFKTIAVGEFILKNPLIGTPHEEGTGSFDDKTAIGNLGNSFLRNFVFYMDYEDQRVILEKGDDYGKEFPRPKSGLQFYYNDNKDVEIVFVSPNTPASEVGFEKGDIITAVNGIGVQFYGGIIALRELMRGPAGTMYAIEILRSGRILQKRLALRDLF